MFDFRRSILPVTIIIVLAGCADSTKPIALRVGLFIAGEDQLSARLHYHSRSMKERELRVLDKALESTITKAFRRMFASVHLLESYPTQQMAHSRQLNLVIVTKLMGSGGSFGYQGDKMWNRGESDHGLSVKLTFYTHEMELVTSVTASGSGTAESIGILSTPEKRALVKSVRAAIRNLGDDVVQQVYANPDIRKIAKQNGK